MGKVYYKTEDILDSGECPVCGLCDCNWIPYNCPEDEEIGAFCSECNTHFVDIDGSKEEYQN
jgi:hypothetical protein